MAWSRGPRSRSLVARRSSRAAQLMKLGKSEFDKALGPLANILEKARMERDREIEREKVRAARTRSARHTEARPMRRSGRAGPWR